MPSYVLWCKTAHAIELEEIQPPESTPLNVTNARDLYLLTHSISSNAVISKGTKTGPLPVHRANTVHLL